MGIYLQNGGLTGKFHVLLGPAQVVVGDAAVVAKVRTLHILDGEGVLVTSGLHQATVWDWRLYEESVLVPTHLWTEGIYNRIRCFQEEERKKQAVQTIQVDFFFTEVDQVDYTLDLIRRNGLHRTILRTKI